LSRARREIDQLTEDVARGGSTSETELASLRKAKRDLEQKIVELEDQVGL
jgi:cell division protein FtsB